MKHQSHVENGVIVGASADGRAGPKMAALEIELDDEEEHLSLLRETSEEVQYGRKLVMGLDVHGLRRRWVTEVGVGNGGKGPLAFASGAAMIQGFLRRDLMSHAMYHLRNALALVVLAFFVLLVLEWEGRVLRSKVMEEKDPVSPHVFSYGGKYNRGHDLEPDKPRMPLTPEEELYLENEILDEATEKVGTWDIARENIVNEQAHYVHDPEKSPFASSLYFAKDEELDDRQRRFANRMVDIVQKFGVWKNPNWEAARGMDDAFFAAYDYKDVPVDEFPQGVWQTDKEYIRNFLDEAQALVEAIKEGIMAEYNHNNPDDDEKHLFGVIIGDQHYFINGTAHDNENKTRIPGVAYLPEKAWKGLVRKLLHAMVTSDHFYVVVVGTDETYRANNFAKTQVMQFNYIMEPVFHKLGMALISRNMGMSASTAVSALGGADILGETDILWHVQRIDVEERPGEFDLLQKQAILSGERVPIVLSPQWDDLMEASKGKAWVGNIQPGVDFCQKTTMEILPDAPACHNVHCDEDAWASRKCYVYNSVCWQKRSDWNPDQHADDVGDKDTDYPGHRRHQLEGRKLTLLLLHALNAAIEAWRSTLNDDSPLPLATDLWHVGQVYKEIREAVMSLDRTPGEIAGIPACEKLLKEVDARICHLPMHAYTEWTPRVVPAKSSLLAIINNMVLGADDGNGLYDGPDIMPLAWQLPDDELDVHMIAIAANVTPEVDDDLFGGRYKDDDWNGGDDLIMGDVVNGNDDQSTRLIRQELQRALKKGHGKGHVGGGEVNPAQGADEGKTEEGSNEVKAALPQDKKTPTQTIAAQSNGEAIDGNGEHDSPTAEDTTGVPLFAGERLQIAEGSGWRLSDAAVGFCDGSAQSRCNRRSENMCLLANHNHYQGNIVGNPSNNWLTMRVPGVKHGIILARLAFEGSNRTPDLPSDLVFDYAVNGVVRSVNGSELQNFSKEIVSGLRVYPLVNARDAVIDGEEFGINYEIAIRIRSHEPNCVVRLSHIYFA